MASCHFLGMGFCFAKPQEMVTADILSAIHAVFSPFGVFATQKLQEIETAGIHAGLKQRPPCRFFAFRGPGVSRSETPKNQKAQPFWFGIHAGLKQRPPLLPAGEKSNSVVHKPLVYEQ
jgi:hypothetical protein